MVHSVERIVEFIKPYYPEISAEGLREVIEKHIEYDTIAYPTDKDGEFLGVAVWNIKDDTAYIESVVVNPKYERGRVLKYLVGIGWTKFKWVKYIAFERRFKKNDKGMRKYKISSFF